MKLFAQLLQNKKAMTGLVILTIIILVAIFAPLLTEYSPVKRVGRPHQAPSWDHWMGTTRLGHDVFSRLVHGARVSLAVGFGAGLMITLIGTVLGIIAGYKGGVIDEVIKVVRRLRQNGTSVLLVEQNTNLAFAVADRGYVISLGRLVVSGSIPDLKSSAELSSAYLGGVA